MKRGVKLGCILIIVSLITGSMTGCGGSGGSPNTDRDISRLAQTEVREYEGEKLSSIVDFRENSIKGPQFITQSSYRLRVDGLVDNPKTYTYGDVVDRHNKYTKAVELSCVEGWNVTILWEGVLVRDFLKEAGIKPNAKVVIFHARDGYTTSFPVDYLMKNQIIMAYRMNGVTLPPERGFPFQLVAEQKWGYKWIKWIERIELSDKMNYKGYWESRGYNNEGRLDKYYLGD